MSKKSLLKKSGLVSLATLLSRLLGLVRELLFAALLGDSNQADAFRVAFVIPNFLRDLFAEGSLSQAFIPTFKKEQIDHGKDAAFALTNRVAGTLFLIIGMLTLAASFFAEPLVGVVATGFEDTPDKFALAVLLTRIMLPFLGLVSIAAVCMGSLNANHKFTAPALAPAFFNVVAIVVGLSIFYLGFDKKAAAIGWSVGVLLGGLCQIVVQTPSLFRLGFRPKLSADLFFKHPTTRRIGKLMLPSLIGLAAVQINILVAIRFASSQDGAVNWLNYAYRLIHLPVGIFGVAIATVSTARYADAVANKELTVLKDHMMEGLRLVVFLTLPSAIGLILLDQSIISLLYERRAFSADTTIHTALALRYYALGLVAFAAIKVIAPLFFALDQAKIPLIASLAAVATNLTISVSLHGIYGYKILALATAMAALVNAFILYIFVIKKLKTAMTLELVVHTLKVFLASLVMGVAVFTLNRGVLNTLGTETFVAKLGAVFIPIVVGVLAFALVSNLLGVREIKSVVDALKKRLQSKS